MIVVVVIELSIKIHQIQIEINRILQQYKKSQILILNDTMISLDMNGQFQPLNRIQQKVKKHNKTRVILTKRISNVFFLSVFELYSVLYCVVLYCIANKVSQPLSNYSNIHIYIPLSIKLITNSNMLVVVFVVVDVDNNVYFLLYNIYIYLLLLFDPNRDQKCMDKCYCEMSSL